MITFKSTESLSKPTPSDPANPTSREFVDRLITEHPQPGHPCNSQDYGYVLIEEPDVDCSLYEIWDGYSLLNIY